MTIEFAENSLAAFHDGEAAKHMKEAANCEQLAETSTASRTAYQVKAQEHQQKAIEHLEAAKNAAGRLK
jgi:hypothetical protein